METINQNTDLWDYQLFKVRKFDTWGKSHLSIWISNWFQNLNQSKWMPSNVVRTNLESFVLENLQSFNRLFPSFLFFLLFFLLHLCISRILLFSSNLLWILLSSWSALSASLSLFIVTVLFSISSIGALSVCLCVCVCVCVCVYFLVFFHCKDFSWLNKTINGMPGIRPAMLCWGNISVSRTFVATS